MFESAYRLLSVFEEVDAIYGRKKVQKMIHLLESSGTDMPYKYEYHFYGPYSAELQDEVNRLVQQQFLAETKEDGAYRYTISDKGREFRQTLEVGGGYAFACDRELLQDMNQQSSQFLEMVSTYAFLIDSGYEPPAAREKAGELKEHLSKYMEEAIAFYHAKVAGN